MVSLLLAAAYVKAEVINERNEVFVVLAPKTIRPGLSINLQYNSRHAPSYDSLVTEIIQNNELKANYSRTFTGGLCEQLYLLRTYINWYGFNSRCVQTGANL